MPSIQFGTQGNTGRRVVTRISILKQQDSSSLVVSDHVMDGRAATWILWPQICSQLKGCNLEPKKDTR